MKLGEQKVGSPEKTGHGTRPRIKQLGKPVQNREPAQPFSSHVIINRGLEG
jgi:hypothetical protein